MQMKPSRRVLFAVILAVVGGITACERTDGLGQLTGPVAPRYGFVGANTKILKHTRLVSTDKVCTSRPIDEGGGVLVYDGGYIQVAYLAVTSPTIFCAQNRAGTDDNQIDLTAYRVSDGTAVTQFTAPVFLKIDISDAPGNVDYSQVFIVYLNPNGTLESIPTSVDKNRRTLTGVLSHFSDYSPATN